MTVRRGIGALICAAIVSLPIASGLNAFVHGNEQRTFGLVILIGTALLAALNCYLSLRRVLYRRRYGTTQGFKYISGFPVLGTALLVMGSLYGFGSLACAGIGLVAVVLDTGGIPWFVVATWKDDSLWGS